jgi:hypothetical protein
MGITHLSGLEVAGVPTMGMGGGLPLVAGLGNYWFVSSTQGSNGNTGTADSPLATLDFAIGKCVANRGDVIVLLPNHAETISSNTALNFDVAGITIVGLGTGAARPTFTLGTANTTRIPVSAANIKISNCIFVGNFLSIATCFLLTTAPGFWVDACAFRDTSAILGFLSIITTTVSVNADGLRFTNNTVNSLATTSPGPTLVVAGTMDRLTITGNFITHATISNNVSALLEHGALVVTSLLCEGNRVYSVNTDTATGALLIKTTATTGSGIVANNYAAALDTAGAILFTATAIQYGYFNNYYAHRGNTTSGYLLPAVGTD